MLCLYHFRCEVGCCRELVLIRKYLWNDYRIAFVYKERKIEQCRKACCSSNQISVDFEHYAWPAVHQSFQHPERSCKDFVSIGLDFLLKVYDEELEQHEVVMA